MAGVIQGHRMTLGGLANRRTMNSTRIPKTGADSGISAEDLMGLGGSASTEKTSITRTKGLQSGMRMQLNLQHLPSKYGIVGRTPAM